MLVPDEYSAVSHRLKLLGSFALAAGLFAVIVWVAGPDSFVEASKANPLYMVLVFVVTALIVVAATARWGSVLRAIDVTEHFPIASLFRVVVVGLALGLVVSVDVGSASSRVVFLVRNKRMSLERAGFSTLFDRGLDVVVLLVGVPASLLFVTGALNAAVAGSLMIAVYVGVLLAVFWRPNALPWATAWLFALAMFVLALLRRKGASGVAQRLWGTSDLTGGHAAVLLALGIARFGLVGMRAWLVILAVGGDVSLGRVLLVLPLVQATLMVPFIPGGMGVYDAGWFGALAVLGVPTDAILVFVVLHRILSTLSVLLLFALGELGALFRRATGNVAS